MRRNLLGMPDMLKRLSLCRVPGITSTEDERMRLGSLCGLWRSKLGAEDFIPETTRDAEPVLVVCVVVLEMVLLELLIVGWKATTAINIGYRTHGKYETYVL